MPFQVSKKMVSIKLAILKSKPAKDGTFRIRVAIGHQSETCYILTPYSINSPSEFVNGTIVRLPNSHELNVKLRNLLNDYVERLERIPSPAHYTCRELRDALQSMKVNASGVTFSEVSKRYQRELTEDGSKSYADMLQNALRLFQEFCNGDIFLTEITTNTVSDFERSLKRKGLSQAYIGMNMSMTRTVINKAIKYQLVSYNIHPFLYWKRGSYEEREIDISIESLIAIRDSDPRLKKHRIARDVFMLSYYLGGINLIDMLNIDFRNVSVLEYTRHKSRNMKQGNKRTSFTIQPEAKALIDKWMNKDTGFLDFGYKYVYRNFCHFVSAGIKSLAEELNLPNYHKVCFYSARKSFVQHGFDLGVSLEVLEYCIGQSVKNNRPIFNYLKIMRRHADVAMRKIFDNLKQHSYTSYVD